MSRQVYFVGDSHIGLLEQCPLDVNWKIHLQGHRTMYNVGRDGIVFADFGIPNGSIVTAYALIS